jgi:hypothetical protein
MKRIIFFLLFILVSFVGFSQLTSPNKNFNSLLRLVKVGGEWRLQVDLGYNNTFQDLATRTWATSSFVTSEADPNVGAHIKSITTNEKSNWNTAYGWGNHSGLYPLLLGSYSDPSWLTISKTKVGLGNVPNLDATNPSNIGQTSSFRFVSDVEKAFWNARLTRDSLDLYVKKSDTVFRIGQGLQLALKQGEDRQDTLMVTDKLAQIANLTPAEGDMLQHIGDEWVNRTIAQLRGSLSINGGSSGYVLRKSSGTDGDYTWQDPLGIFTYNGSVKQVSSNLQLENDEENPGANKVYATDNTEEKGWMDMVVIDWGALADGSFLKRSGNNVVGDNTVITTGNVATASTTTAGYLSSNDYKRIFGHQSFANPASSSTISVDVTSGGIVDVTFTSSGGRTIAFSNLRTTGNVRDQSLVHFNNTSGGAITLTLPSNSYLAGTGSAASVNIPSGYSTLGLVKYDGTNYFFALNTF